MSSKRWVSSALSLLLIGLACGGSARADFDEEPTTDPLPQPALPAGAVQFDSEFISGLMLAPHLDNYIEHTQNIEKMGNAKSRHRDFAIFVEVFQFVSQFVNQFAETRDKQYATVGDFRAYYLHTLPKMFPKNTFLEVNAFQTTSGLANTVIVKTMGGGAGMRVEFKPTADGALTFSILPVYGEKRSFNTRTTELQGGSDFILRASAAMSYRQKLGKHVEPGVQVFFQPQIIDFGQFRIYAEAFIRFKITSDSSKPGQYLKVREISIVPKVIYWHSTDQNGLFGDPIEQRLGETYARLSSNLYGFMNLEFHFGM